MAQVTVRVRMNRTFEMILDAENEDEALDALLGNSEFESKLISAGEEEMEIVEATYDEPELDEEEDDLEDEEEEKEEHGS